MSPEQVKALHDSGLVEIGGHTMTHPFLSKLSESEQREEILRNKLELEALIGEPLTSFAYPYGDHDATSKQLAQDLGYPFAVATNSGPL
ncbi:polysaccharide deacetylase family protein, partial [Vibrio cholerae]